MSFLPHGGLAVSIISCHKTNISYNFMQINDNLKSPTIFHADNTSPTSRIASYKDKIGPLNTYQTLHFVQKPL